MVVRLPMYIFLFMQKTAYEMRISDWSSDVCSSDLDVDIGIIVHVRPVEHAWNLPPGLPDAISGDLHHRSDEIVIEDPAIVGTGGSAQFGPSIVGLVEFDLFGPVRDEPVRKVDPR